MTVLSLNSKDARKTAFRSDICAEIRQSFSHDKNLSKDKLDTIGAITGVE
jgi:hypothetical protein